MAKRTFVGVFALMLAVATADAVQVTEDSGMYTHPDYPGNQFDLPAPRHLASEAARDTWRDQRFGLFIHWGIYAVLEGMWKGEQIPDLGEQIQRHAKIPGKEYIEVARRFNPVKFDARAYARLAKAAGMNYIIITSKHHDGFAMFDSKYTDFDIMDASPYKRDIIGPLPDGSILPYHEASLLKIGVWAKTHAEAIYDAKPTPFELMPWGEATLGDGKLYLHVSRWPADGKLVVADLLTRVKRVHWLPEPGKELAFRSLESGIEIALPAEPLDKNLTVLTFELDGNIETRVPLVTVKNPGHIVLDGSARRTEEFYTGMSYHNRIRNVRSSWDFPVAKGGVFQLKLTVGKGPKKRPKHMKGDAAPVVVVVVVGGKQFHVGLPMNAPGTVLDLGNIDLPAGERVSLIVTADIEAMKKGKDDLQPHLVGMMVDIDKVELTR